MSNSVCDAKGIKTFFQKDFIPTDNIPESTASRDKICMEARASLLIEAHCTGERFAAFMKCGRYTPEGWFFSFPEPYVRKFPFPQSYPATEITWTFREFKVNSKRPLINENGGVIERWELYLSSWNGTPQTIPDFCYRLKDNTSYSAGDLENALKQVQEYFQQEFRSRFNLCSQLSPYKTPEQVCRFFGNQPEVFGKLKLSGMWPDCLETEEVSHANQNRIVGFLNQYCGDSHYQIFSFKDQYGDTRMQVMRFYDPETQSKVLIPITSWMRSHFPYNQLYCVPVPEDKQPLFNLDLLLNPEIETVILTDSVELADFNQHKAPDGVVFTSFLCSPGIYESVDWTPLQDKEVWYLVTNHSGISLDAAYVKAQDLAGFLRDQYDIRLKFIQLKVEYPECHFKSVDMLLKMYREQPPKVNPASVVVFENDADFDIQYRKAEESITAISPEWWEQQENVSPEEKRIADKESKKRIPPSYLLRPFLLRGEVSMLYASKSTGKSALALSMAATVISGKPLFYEKWWTVPTQRDYPSNKVLYLDFENGQKEIRERRIDFAEPYWPEDQGKRVQCEANLIIEDMTNCSGKDYSLPENWQDIVTLIDAAKNKGTKGQPIDLLVIDTVSKFTRKPYTSSVNLSDFINMVRKLNIAILLIHHEGSNGKIRGWKALLDDFYFNLRLYRELPKEEDEDEEDEDAQEVLFEGRESILKTLEEPLILACQSSRSGIEKLSDFEIYFDKKWQEFHNPNDPNSYRTADERRKEEFRNIVETYSKRRLENQDIFPMLGISKDTYYKLKK